ncbi:MAG TPA: glucose-6-phosphate dehydrogenase [Acidobacteriota bacterium]|nr:glucose-6-phosphate dehydrogenase [Acidobacteriota bacterium]
MITQLENPLRMGLRIPKAADPCAIVIFGATGDLTRRKLIPALYSLSGQNLLGTGCAIVGAGRTEMSHDQFRQSMREAIQEFTEEKTDDAEWQTFASMLYYNRTDMKDPATVQRLKELLSQLDKEHATSGNRLFYLATPPSSYGDVASALGQAGMNRPPEGGRWARIIIEKPFGRNAQSARELNRQFHEVFSEDQVYRIDHYLGKETVQNIAVLRFANLMFEPVWNRNYIDHVQITAAESIGVENRASYYEQAGVLRDMIQNHMLQLLTLIAGEPPVAMEANSVRDEKVKVIRAMRSFDVEDIKEIAVRGQYTRGVIGGKEVPGYREEEGVNPNSKIETFAAIVFRMDNWRWAGVPFYVRSGKRLPKRVTEVAIQFKRVPHHLFPEALFFDPNWLIIRIQPDEGISIKFAAKVPGQMIQIRPVSMDFQYGNSFGKKSPEAYERLLLDAMIGDATLYARADMVELCWDLVMPILNAWEKDGYIPFYPAGTWGPDEAEKLIEKDGRKWRRP